MQPIFTAESLTGIPLEEIAAVLNACFVASIEADVTFEKQVRARMKEIFRTGDGITMGQKRDLRLLLSGVMAKRGAAA